MCVCVCQSPPSLSLPLPTPWSPARGWAGALMGSALQALELKPRPRGGQAGLSSGTRVGSSPVLTTGGLAATRTPWEQLLQGPRLSVRRSRPTRAEEASEKHGGEAGPASQPAPLAGLSCPVPPSAC